MHLALLNSVIVTQPCKVRTLVIPTSQENGAQVEQVTFPGHRAAKCQRHEVSIHSLVPESVPPPLTHIVIML
jgi:hypothetical protein